MKEHIGFGIVGTGTVSNYHIAAIRANSALGAELIGACGNSPEKARKFCEEKGIAYFENLNQMLESDDIDVVTICTPSGMHAETAEKAIRAGKHVVIEKPVCIVTEDSDRLLEAARKTDKIVSVISQYRFSDSAIAIKNAMDAGAFGKLVLASLTMRYFRSQDYYNSGAWRGTKNMDGGGILMNQGIHGIDLISFLMGPVNQVTGYTKTRLREIEVEDTAAAALSFENGAIGTIDATVCHKGGSPMRIVISGENGSVTMEDDAITEWNLDVPCPVKIGVLKNNSSGASPTGISTENHTRQFADIISAIKGEKPVAVSVRDGRHALQIICGIYKSSVEGKPITLTY